MSVAVVGTVAVAGSAIYGAVSSSNAQDRALDQAEGAAAADLELQRARYAESKRFLTGYGNEGENLFEQGIEYGEQSLATAQGQSDLYQNMSQQYADKAQDNEALMANYFDEFLGGFETMLAGNDQALADFNRRYGNIMDNVQEGIVNISADSLAAQGREQLSLDSKTLMDSFNSGMASRNLGRSGMTVEAEMRMAQDTAVQARAIDVNANQQALQLQGQGIQNLNSMFGMEQGIKDQRQVILSQQGQANQQIGNTYGNLAQNFYGASQNMFGQGFTNTLNAQNNLASMFGQQGVNQMNQEASFYSGAQLPNSSNLINSYNNQAASAGADASGYMQTAGTVLGSSTGQNALSSLGGMLGFNPSFNDTLGMY